MLESVRTAAMLMEEMTDASDDQLVESLVDRAIARELAHELVAFVPLAFARHLLRDSGVRFSPSFALIERGRIAAVIPLSSEPTYGSALAVAEEFSSTQASSHSFLAIAGRSAELRAINKLLNKGSKLENMVMSDPLVELPLRQCSERPSWWKTLRWLFGGLPASK